MRLGSLTLSATLSAFLLSGCSFIGGQPSGYKNPFAKQKAANQGQYSQQAYGQHCQIATPRQPIPRGCRPEQVTIGTAPQGQYQQGYGAQGGFPQQPQYGQPQYADGAYGSAVGQSPAMKHHTVGPKKRKPKLRGSLSLGLERSVSGELIEYGIRDDLDPRLGYNPQDFNEGFSVGSQTEGNITTTTYTANELDAANIFAPNTFESSSRPAISFDDAWAAPASLKAGLEYIVNDNTTVFANGGYTYAEGNAGDVSSVTATLYEQTSSQDYVQNVDGAGDPIPGSFSPNGAPAVNIAFVPNERIATFAYDFSDLERYDLEIGARRYLNPIVKSEGFRTVTPFVGASVGVSRVNAVEFTQSQTQTFYQRAFEGQTADLTYSVPTADTPTRLYDAQWLPQGQLNVGAEWQVTPGFAIAAETGLRLQDGRDYADFTNAAGDLVEGRKGDMNISVPVTLRGSINF
ncbi:MAG: hypothetical protein ABJN22_11890 [Litorimonas sp.]